MEKSIKKLVMNYLREVATNECSDEDIQYMAEKFVNDYKKIKAARKDFKVEE